MINDMGKWSLETTKPETQSQQNRQQGIEDICHGSYQHYLHNSRDITWNQFESVSHDTCLWKNVVASFAINIEEMALHVLIDHFPTGVEHWKHMDNVSSTDIIENASPDNDEQ